MFDFFKYL